MNEYVKQILLVSKDIQEDYFRIVTKSIQNTTHLNTIKSNNIPQTDIYTALNNISENLGNSYSQVNIDIQTNTRLSWAGTAHEIREILATLLRILAPDNEVANQPWYIQEPNTSKPTHKQRVRYILEKQGASSNTKDVAEQIGIIDNLVANLVRNTYTRASDAAHRFKKPNEVKRILRYFDAFVSDLLNI
jgi:hypothetical protein